MVEACARTHIGKKRESNQDALWADADLEFYLVADGMGGHAFGAEASATAVRVITETVRTACVAQEDIEKSHRESVLRKAFFHAHEAIVSFARDQGMTEPVGTTATALWFDQEEAVIGHIGDSRAYRLRQGALTQLTQDQTVAQELVEMGRLDPAKAEQSRFSNVLARVLGVEDKCHPEMFSVDVQPGDIFLLCSDGLTKVVSDEQIQYRLENARENVSCAADYLIDDALSAGAPDNVTIILLKVLEV